MVVQQMSDSITQEDIRWDDSDETLESDAQATPGNSVACSSPLGQVRITFPSVHVSLV